MNIVIVGAGQVGAALADKLSRESHDVSLVDPDPQRVRELSELLDARVLLGNGATAAALRTAGVASADLVVASTDSDEVNLLVGALALGPFGRERVIVRLRDANHEEGFRLLTQGQSAQPIIITPEAAAVERIASLLEVPGALDLVEFFDGELLLAGFRIGPGSEFAERPVSDMRLFFAETPTLVAALGRGDAALVPGGGESIQVGDLVYLVIARADLEGVLGLLGHATDDRRRIMVAGATRIGLALVRRLSDAGRAVTLLEGDVEEARRAAQELGEGMVIHGPATDHGLLDEEEIERVATFVAVTRDDETNLVAGLLAKRMGVGRAFALVDNPALANLIGETAIDAIVSPRLLAIELTLGHVTRARLHSAAVLLGDRVEILEAEATRGSPLTAGPLRDVSLPKGILVVAIQREGALLVPRGDDRVEPGDRLLLVTQTDQANRLVDYLSA